MHRNLQEIPIQFGNNVLSRRTPKAMIIAKGMQMAAPSASRLMSLSELECVLLWLDLVGYGLERA
jgi:hypothetical protein